MKNVILMSVVLFLTWNPVVARGPATAPEFVKFEVRAASETRRDGWLEMVASSSNKTFWVDQSEPLLSNRHCESVDLAEDNPGTVTFHLKDGSIDESVRSILSRPDRRQVVKDLRFGLLGVVINDELLAVQKAGIDVQSETLTVEGITFENPKRIVDGILIPNFRAQLLFVISDWSTVTSADTIADDMRSVLSDAAVSQDLIDRLPESATEILFPAKMASSYSPENYAGLFAWLTSMDLIVESHELPVKSGDWRGRQLFIDPAVVGLKGQEEFDQPFVKTRHELEWSLMEAENSEFHAMHRFRVVTTARGQTEPGRSKNIYQADFRFQVPDDRFIIGNAFPESADSPLRAAARKKGLTMVVVVGRTNLFGTTARQPARFCLPDSVEILIPSVSAKGELPFGRSSVTSAANGTFPYFSFHADDAPVSTDAASGAVNEPIGVKVFPLKNLSAARATNLFTELFGGRDLEITVDANSHQVIVRGPEDSLGVFEATLLRLDSTDRSSSASAVDTTGAENTAVESADSLKEAYERTEAEALATAEELRQLQDVDSSDGDTAERIAELRATLEKQVSGSFELRQALNSAELNEMAGKIEDAKKSLELRNRIQDQIVARRIEDLLNPDTQWPDAP